MSEDTRKMVVRLVSIIAITAAVLAFNANSFDESEMKVLGQLVLFLGAGGIADVFAGRAK
jgi:hypothetical protein